MTLNTPSESVLINIHINPAMKEKLAKAASLEGKKISALVRESIEDKITMIEKEQLEKEMKIAYLEMSRENEMISEDFKYSDSENLE